MTLLKIIKGGLNKFSATLEIYLAKTKTSCLSDVEIQILSNNALTMSRVSYSSLKLSGRLMRDLRLKFHTYSI